MKDGKPNRKIPHPRRGDTSNTETKTKNMHTRTLLAALAALSLLLPRAPAFAQFPPAVQRLSWQADNHDKNPWQGRLFSGETAILSAELRNAGGPIFVPAGTPVGMWWQTDAMPSGLWHGAPAAVTQNGILSATFKAPAPGTVRFFFRLGDAAAVNYTVNGRLTILPSPGADPEEIPLPTPRLDFAHTEILNAPWPAEIAAATNALWQGADGATDMLRQGLDSATNALWQGVDSAAADALLAQHSASTAQSTASVAGGAASAAGITADAAKSAAAAAQTSADNAYSLATFAAQNASAAQTLAADAQPKKLKTSFASGVTYVEDGFGYLNYMVNNAQTKAVTINGKATTVEAALAAAGNKSLTENVSVTSPGTHNVKPNSYVAITPLGTQTTLNMDGVWKSGDRLVLYFSTLAGASVGFKYTVFITPNSPMTGNMFSGTSKLEFKAGSLLTAAYAGQTYHATAVLESMEYNDVSPPKQILRLISISEQFIP